MPNHGSDPYSWYQNNLRKDVPSSQSAGPEARNLQGAQESEVKKEVSARKIEANRENAKQSTGPKTSRGKKVVAKNAIQHGFFARVAVISDEDSGETQQEFDELLAALRKALQPVGKCEDLVVEAIAVGEWRKRRILRYENGMIADRFSRHRDQIATKSEMERLCGNGELFPVSPQRKAELEDRTDHLCMAAENADLILRYLATIDKELHRNLALLMQLQARRRSAGAGQFVTLSSDQPPMKSEIEVTRTSDVSGIENDSREFSRVQSDSKVAEKVTERPAQDVDVL